MVQGLGRWFGGPEPEGGPYYWYPNVPLPLDNETIMLAIRGLRSVIERGDRTHT